jgi:hypothetical protein
MTRIQDVNIKRHASVLQARQALASIGLAADLAALIAINICLVTLGALLYSALRRLGSTVSRMQRYIATIGAVFFVALLLRSVYALTFPPPPSPPLPKPLYTYNQTSLMLKRCMCV